MTLRMWVLGLVAILSLTACREYRLPFIDTNGNLWMGYWVREPAYNKPLTLVAAQRLFSLDDRIGIWPSRIGTHSDGCLINWANPSEAVLCPGDYSNMGIDVTWGPGEGPQVALRLFAFVE